MNDDGTMRIVSNLASLEPSAVYWVAAVVAPVRDWAGAPGCRRGARFLIDPVDLRAGHSRVGAFVTRAACLRWIMAHRAEIEEHAPSAPIAAVLLDQWLLGLDTVPHRPQ
jgi:hypothetical protein